MLYLSKSCLLGVFIFLTSFSGVAYAADADVSVEVSQKSYCMEEDVHVPREVCSSQHLCCGENFNHTKSCVCRM